jgi:putative two-component system response regulator
MHILAVDDNAVNLATLEQELQNKYDVTALNSGSRAVRFLCREQVDLILLDVQMPIMNGIETLSEMRSLKNGADVPVIFLTASSDKSTVMEGMKLGIVDYIVKPFRPRDLHNRIEKALKQHGSLALEGQELYHKIQDVLDDIHNNDIKGAYAKGKEILTYKLDDDVSGRMHVVVSKLDSGDPKAAEQMIERLYRLLEKRGIRIQKEKDQSINKIELTVRLQYAIHALEDFHTKEAEEKLTTLLQYKMSDSCKTQCEQALACIREYNDVEAEHLLRSVLEKVS